MDMTPTTIWYRDAGDDGEAAAWVAALRPAVPPDVTWRAWPCDTPLPVADTCGHAIALAVLGSGVDPGAACRRAIADCGPADVPLVVMTAAADAAAAIDAFAAGADDVVAAGTDARVAAARLAAAIRRRASARQSLDVMRTRCAADATRLGQELDALVYAVSHDLRAPLRSVDGFSAALAEQLGTSLEPKAQDYLDRVRAAGQRMAAMIDGLLELSRIGRAAVTPEPIELEPLVQGAMAAIAGRTPERAVALEVDDVTVVGDRKLLRRLFDVLLANAWKFTAPVAAPAIAVRAERGPRDTVLSVHDNGIGFDMAYAGKLFRPFQRLHAPTEYAGLGLGLALAQRIARRHDGEIWAESAPERGTTVSVRLGASMPPAAGAGR